MTNAKRFSAKRDVKKDFAEDKMCSQPVVITDEALNEQELEQDLTHYYKIIFTLKNGVQIEILTREKLKFSSFPREYSWKIVGFMKTPLLVKKEVQIVQEEIAAIEVIKDPCIAQVIPWPETELDPSSKWALNRFGKDGFGPLEERDKKDELLVTHKPDCAIHNNPPAGFASSVSDCDCGAIVPCTDAAGQDKTKQNEWPEEHPTPRVKIGHPQVGPIENRPPSGVAQNNGMYNDNDQGHH